MVDFCVRLDHRYEHRVARSTVTLVTNQPSRLPDYLHKPAGKYDLDGQPIHCGFEGTTDDYAWSEDTSEELLQRVGLSIEKVEEEPVLASPSVLVECQSDYVFNQHELTEAFEEIGVGPLRERFRLARSIRKPRRFLNIFMGLCAKMGDRYSYDAPNPRNLGDIFHHPAPLPGLQLAICNIPVWGPGYKKHQTFSRGAGKSWIEHMKTGPGLRLLFSTFFCPHVDPVNRCTEGTDITSCDDCKKQFQIADAGFPETAFFMRHVSANLRQRVFDRLRPLLKRAFFKANHEWVRSHLMTCSHTDHKGKIIPFSGRTIDASGFPRGQIRSCYKKHTRFARQVDSVLLQRLRCIVADEVGVLAELLLSTTISMPHLVKAEDELVTF